jgi:SAM-dependent methyltransferase
MSVQFHPAAWVVGLEGYAMLLAMAGDGSTEFVTRRLAEVRAVLDAIDNPQFAYHVKADAISTERGYAVWASTYDDEGNPLIAVEEPVVRRFLKDVAPGAAIDVACGTGRIARILAEHGHDVVGVDSSVAMLARATSAVADAALVRGNLHSLAARSASADVVTCCLALTHQTDLRAAFEEFARVLRPGGVLVTSDIHVATLPLGGVAKAVIDGRQYAMQASRFWPSEYVAAARTTGFDVVDCAEPWWSLPDGGGGEFAQQWAPEAAALCYRQTPAAIVWKFRRSA